MSKKDLVKNILKAAEIINNNRRSSSDFFITSPQVAEMLDRTLNNKKNKRKEKIKSILQDWSPNQIGNKGEDTGYVYCPYILHTKTAPVIYEYNIKRLKRMNKINSILDLGLNLKSDFSLSSSIRSRYFSSISIPGINDKTRKI